MCVVDTHSVCFPNEKPCNCDTRNEMHIVASCGLDSVEGTFCPESRKKESVGGAGIVVFSFWVPSAYL